MENCKINIEAWPSWAKWVLARNTLAAVKRFKEQPGGKERLDEMVSEHRAKVAANGESNV